MLVKIIRRYDPSYKEKLAEIAGVINTELKSRKGFTIPDVNRHLDFDCDRHIRL